MHPLITLEEHFLSHDILRSRQESGTDPYARFPPTTVSKLLDLSHSRLADMDAGSVSLQIISHGPGDFSTAVCRATNDALAASIQANPTRLAGWAMLPMAEPDAAADELSRSVQSHGFVGALIENHLAGRFYDDGFFWPVFARAEALGVPLYIHPTWAPPALAQHYRGNFSEDTAFMMSIAGWGWHAETALHVLRLFASGVFDEYPRLKIVIGHMGEMLPFQLDRIVAGTRAWDARKRGLREVWEQNIWVTTSGMFSLAPLACLLRVSPIDKILYSVDYPFSTNEKGKAFVEEMEKSGLLTKEQLEAICYKNAENLLGVKAPK